MSVFDRDDRAPQPWGWELPAGGALCWVLVAAILAPVGQGAASFLAGQGWCCPTQTGLFPAVGGLFTGHPARGLTAAAAAGLPATWVVYTAIALAELAWIAVTGLGMWVWQREFADTKGWATRRDAADALGVDRLHRRCGEIRPDLYPAKKRKRARA